MAALGGLVLSSTLVVPQREVEWTWWGAAILLIMTRAAEAGFVEITRESDAAGGYGVSVATVPQLVAVLLLPPPVAALLAAAGMLVDQVSRRSSLLHLVFNVSSTTFSVGLAALGANLLGVSGAGLAEPGLRSLLAYIAIAVGYYVSNTAPVSCIGALAGGRSVWRALLRSARTTAPTEL